MKVGALKVGDYLCRKMNNVPNQVYVIVSIESYGGLVLNYKIGRVRLRPEDHADKAFDRNLTIEPGDFRFDYYKVNIVILDI